MYTKNYYNYICVYVQPVNIIFIMKYEPYYLRNMHIYYYYDTHTYVLI
jgi:hypothetical protein